MNTVVPLVAIALGALGFAFQGVVSIVLVASALVLAGLSVAAYLVRMNPPDPWREARRADRRRYARRRKSLERPAQP
jgi:hypothetical protein